MPRAAVPWLTRPQAAPGTAARLTLAGAALTGAVWWLSITYRWPLVGDCWFRHLTGWPCPGCGMGRACQALLLGQWRAAVAWHPLAPLFAPALLISAGWLAADAWRGRASFFPALQRATAGPWVRALLLSAVVGAWAWNLAQGKL